MKDFVALSKESQETEYEHLKQELKYTEVTGENYVYITRRVMYETLPQGWEEYIPFIKHMFPDGEKRIFYPSQSIIDNYLRLWSWSQGGCCDCGAVKDNQYWWHGDKRICFVCDMCNAEAGFCRHGINDGCIFMSE